MPRFYNERNDALDYCRRCWPAAVLRHDMSPADAAYGSDHPPYTDDDYRCETCSTRLGNAD